MSVAGPDLRLPELLVEKVVAEALAEDLGEAGDITTVATVEPGAIASGAIAARKPGVVAGLQVAEAAFRVL
ncbi:MAG: nicotinate-nucleotide diphosphorylase (carboxylating), partial [Hyphomicrobium sp.]